MRIARNLAMVALVGIMATVAGKAQADNIVW
jgi:hypothetical protein